MQGLLPTIVPGSLTVAGTPRRRALRRVLLLGCILGGSLLLSLEGLRMLVGKNSHVVLPGRVYRSAQLSPDNLRDIVRENNIRTVINLRGFCPSLPWYPDECRTTQELGIAQEDVTLSANRLPSPPEIRRLVEVLDGTEYPVLFHCRRGADRTGLASVVAMLLYSDADYGRARRQCSPRYGHWPILTTASMDEFFAMYERQLTKEGIAHSPARFRAWILQEYCPTIGRARLELLTDSLRFSTNETPYLKIRAHNRSDTPWQFKAGTFAGVYLDCTVMDASGKGLHRLRFGQRECVVEPGEFIDLDTALPSFSQAGRYYVNLDLAERQIPFVQYGSEILMLEIIVSSSKFQVPGSKFQVPNEPLRKLGD